MNEPDLSPGGNLGRNANREGRSLARFAMHGDIAAHHLAKLPRDGEAQAGAAVRARRQVRRRRKYLEQLLHLVGCHADAGIADAKLDPRYAGPLTPNPSPTRG